MTATNMCSNFGGFRSSPALTYESLSFISVARPVHGGAHAPSFQINYIQLAFLQKDPL